MTVLYNIRKDIKYYYSTKHEFRAIRGITTFENYRLKYVNNIFGDLALKLTRLRNSNT